MADTETTEWSVMRRFDPVTPTLHRGPMTFDEARTWIEDWEDDGGRLGVFALAYREVGPWVAVPASVKVAPR